MAWPCNYASGTCDHYGCGPLAPPEEPEPSVEDYCGSGGHAYAGDDDGRGRCYCGTRTFPLGGGE